MKLYNDEALENIREETKRLYATLASTKPSDDLTRDDIRSLMYYIKEFGMMAATEQNRRKRLSK